LTRAACETHPKKATLGWAKAPRDNALANNRLERPSDTRRRCRNPSVSLVTLIVMSNARK